MRQYVLRRLALAVPTLVLVSVIVFSIMRFMPGDVVIRMVEAAVALSLAVFGFNMLGDALRDLLDPRLRGG